jgi:hypothetical protein
MQIFFYSNIYIIDWLWGKKKKKRESGTSTEDISWFNEKLVSFNGKLLLSLSWEAEKKKNVECFPCDTNFVCPSSCGYAQPFEAHPWI